MILDDMMASCLLGFSAGMYLSNIFSDDNIEHKYVRFIWGSAAFITYLVVEYM